jgi:hypothetical protein
MSNELYGIHDLARASQSLEPADSAYMPSNLYLGRDLLASALAMADQE